jgi:hypothetical protein
MTMPKTNVHTIMVEVAAPKRLSHDDVAGLVEMLIGAGMSDAEATAHDPDLDSDRANDALSLTIRKVR